MEREDDARVGLCARCRHARLVPTPRATYWLCRLSEVDPRFERYPRLPVLRCAGFEPGPREGVEPAAGDRP